MNEILSKNWSFRETLDSTNLYFCKLDYFNAVEEMVYNNETA